MGISKILGKAEKLKTRRPCEVMDYKVGQGVTILELK